MLTLMTGAALFAAEACNGSPVSRNTRESHAPLMVDAPAPRAAKTTAPVYAGSDVSSANAGSADTTRAAGHDDASTTANGAASETVVTDGPTAARSGSI